MTGPITLSVEIRPEVLAGIDRFARSWMAATDVTDLDRARRDVVEMALAERFRVGPPSRGQG